MRPWRVVCVFLIYVGASVAWLILGASVWQRTDTSFDRLREQVGGLWGEPLEQRVPELIVEETYPEKIEVKDEKGRTTTETVMRKAEHHMVPDSSDLHVTLHSDARRKGLLWYRTYVVEFDGTYTLRHDFTRQPTLTARLTFPSAKATYDDFLFSVNGREAAADGAESGHVKTSIPLPPGETATVRLHYKSRGLDRWAYSFGEGVAQVKNFRLVVDTDFSRYDFPDRSLSPSQKEQVGDGWRLTWRFKNLLSGFRAGVEMPEQPNPGEMVSRISFFAPVGLLFFLAVVVIVGLMRGQNLHPMHFCFAAGGFFAFHLLMAYVADHLDIRATFLLCAAVSVLLVVSYLIRAVGANFALRVAAPAQLVFLVLFSYAFFFKGYTGLTIAMASVLTLAILMHVTAKVDWGSRFAPPRQESP